MKKGCIPNPPDHRDIALGDIPYKPDPKCPTYKQGFDNENKYGKIKREHQGTSSSCVGQAWSKYLEMINKIDTQEFKDLSARDIYSQIYLAHGGAYIREGAKVAVNKGNCIEELMPSYPKKTRYNTGNPDELFMRTRTDTNLIKSNAYIYKSKRFVWLDTQFPLREQDWENMRQVIWQFGGFISGWNGHCVYASGYGIRNNKRFVHFINSYGEGSDWYMWEGSTNYEYYDSDEYKLYDITFLVDLPHSEKTMRYVIKNKEQYLLYDPLKIALNIGDGEELKELQERGLKEQPEPIDDVSEYTVYPLVEKNRLKDLFGL